MIDLPICTYLGTLSIGEWLANNLDPGASVGVDPLLITISEWKKIDQQLQQGAENIKLIGHNINLVDVVWNSNQPNCPNHPIIPLELKFTGKSWEKKFLR